MMATSQERSAAPPQDITGVVPGVRGQRAFPTRQFRDADPFLMLDHIGPQKLSPDRVIDGVAHPHRGFETVSIFLAGSTDHVDSMGGQTRIDAGDVQVMNAGSGIMHGGAMRPDPKTGIFHEFQLWVNVPREKKMSRPSVLNVKGSQIPTIERDGASLRVLTGRYDGALSPAQTIAPTTIIHGKLPGSQVLSLSELERGVRAVLYVIAGSVKVDESVADQFETLDLGRVHGDLNLQSGKGDAEFLLLTGSPLEEPVVFGGPFVMNSQAEIEQAYADFHSGAFGQVPA